MAGLNHNWAGQVDVPEPVVPLPRIHDMPTCVHAILQNCVLPNGDMTLCGMNDVNRELIIGNIFESYLKEIYGDDSKYSSYTLNNQPSCTKCSEYDAKTCEPEDVREHENQLNKIR